ncbi:translation factor Sua5 [Rhodomicrobium udaipurense JA643]|uniref:Threonylcarbamoyl-AMP synthase n=1 Tax=Rhodomicrobium udaipurense TaxID=1202716 RepID=A0A8I1KJU3_9HYPH|nr:L-threonylcarbamoyladenylate synthase [Rhodomicrobium udaipurense]KAI96113.1 translation factor Sua5 [Rhodomicrobium udaipurense JA643]MBJ7544197.1 threonylcarbamoyl-AMP synthase [Rhodomicrobium udaipurense]
MIENADGTAIEKAAHILRSGGLVAFPTETVYGLGADATNGVAVARIFEAKGRPRFNPLIVHVPDAAAARRFAMFDAETDALAARFWPGPLTLVLPLRPDAEPPLSDLVTAGLDTVAIRVPRHPVARALIEAAGVPVAAPSANISGRISPTRAAHVAEDLGGRVDMILDGGAADAGLESTIVALKPRPTLLRPGAVAREDVEAALGLRLADRGEGDGVTAPGQLASHYAPNASVRLDAREARPGETLLGFGPAAPENALNLSRAGDLREAAANLFACLRALDAEKPGRIAVMPIPEAGLGEAINDRLRRAAAPKPTTRPGD